MRNDWQLVLWICWGGALLAFAVNLLYWRVLRQSASTAPRLERHEAAATIATLPIATLPTEVSVTVIIPAYNEAANITDCVRSVLQSVDWNRDRFQVWVVDDQSTDATLSQIQALQAELADSRLMVIPGQPRPTDKPWLGKNWACWQAAQQATSDYVLFVDADVRLNVGAIEAAIAHAQAQQIDLITGILTLVCECWAEWLVQPLIVGFVAAGLPFTAVNDPKSDAMFAAGSFMLFRRSAYEQVGGHAAVANQVVEDVELARRMQKHGLKLHYTIATDLGSLRMYPTAAALWEGWTKNWHLSAHRHIPTTLYGASLVFLLSVLPLLCLVGFGITAAIAGLEWKTISGIAIALVTLLLQYPLRQEIRAIAAIPPRYWWLTSLGGIFFLAIILASIIKTETGWGWTWRGRPLHTGK